MSTAQPTIDHDEIRRWAEARQGVPSRVKSTGGDGDIGIIRIDFPGGTGGDTLEEITWDEWFAEFEESNLALIIEEETSEGEMSRFNKLVSRDSVEARTS